MIAWVGFAVALVFVVFSFAAAAVWVVDVWREAQHEEDLDGLWDDGPEPSWLIRARYEIRELPEVRA